MPKIPLSPSLREDYQRLFDTCAIRPERAHEVAGLVTKLTAQRPRYQSLGSALHVPWFFIAVIHRMECSQQFDKHFHNGDPLTKRAVQVPAGRPRTGAPPFTWEVSARDALSMRRVNARTDWSVAGMLYQLESYNGWGYRLYHPHVGSPYLWSFSNHYEGGKYTADGTWSDAARSKQCGAAVLLRRLAECGDIQFDAETAPDPDGAPLVATYSSKKPRNPGTVAQVEGLQRWLNTFPGIFVKVDGIPGKRTSDAFRKVTGGYLPGDPRG